MPPAADLAARGLDARWVVWDDPDVDWLEEPGAGGRPKHLGLRGAPRRVPGLGRGVGPGLLNGAEVFAWNTDKSYLVDLAATSLPVVPTVSVEEEGRARARDRRTSGPRW